MNNEMFWNNPQSYKPCKKKRYTMYVCMPPLWTVVINKLEYADVCNSLGRTFFTDAEVRDNPQLQKKVQSLVNYQHVAQATTYNKPFVLCGTLGEMRIIGFEELAKNYVYADNTPITETSLDAKAPKGLLKWTAITPVPDNSVAWACFVPENKRGFITTKRGTKLMINRPGISHGLGDFVIAADRGGKPDPHDRWVVNGGVFANTYNNTGWTDCLAKDVPVMDTKHCPPIY